MIKFNMDGYLQAVQDQFGSFMNSKQLKAAFRTASKRVAKHHGLISKYDGRGRKRGGFPVAGDTGGRPRYPRPVRVQD